MPANDLTRYDIMRGNPCGNECCAEMVSWINGDYVLHADAKAALAAKDAALAECVRVMDDLSELMQEHECHVGTTSCVPECRICEAYSWMRATIAKHKEPTDA